MLRVSPTRWHEGEIHISQVPHIPDQVAVKVVLPRARRTRSSSCRARGPTCSTRLLDFQTSSDSFPWSLCERYRRVARVGANRVWGRSRVHHPMYPTTASPCPPALHYEGARDMTRISPRGTRSRVATSLLLFDNTFRLEIWLGFTFFLALQFSSRMSWRSRSRTSWSAPLLPLTSFRPRSTTSRQLRRRPPSTCVRACNLYVPV